MDSAAREELARTSLAFSGADQTEVLVSSSRSALSRFTHNAIHQNVADADASVSVRAIVGGRTGVARTNLQDEASLQACVKRAIDLAKLAPVDPDQRDLPSGGSPEAPEGAFEASTAQATPETRAGMCEKIFEVADAAELWSAGYATTSVHGITIANSQGALSSFDGTVAGINVKMNGRDSAGFAEAYDNAAQALDARAIAAVSAQKARDSANPQGVEPGEWTVILEPPAFGELFAYLADHFSAQSYDEQSSFLSDGLDKEYLGHNVTIRDDWQHPLSPSMPFDYEAAPTQRLALVENGVARGIVTDSYWAGKLHRANTGHALPAPNASGPQARNLVVEPGTKTIEQLIAETRRGLLISRFWYIRTVDQRQAIVTGMTRDGTFLIQNGKIAGGVRNMRFNQSIIESLRRCEFSNELRRTGGFDYSLIVPSAKIEGFSFSSGTDF